MKTLSLGRTLSVGVIALLALAGAAILYSTNVHADTTTPPVVSNLVATPTDTGATIMWNTDQTASTQVEYGLTNTYNASSTLDNTQVTSHTAFLGGLSPGTVYHYAILSNNASGTPAVISDAMFTTLAASTTATSTASTSPIVTNVVATPTDTGATITWNTDTASTTQVFYGLSSGYGSMSTLDTNAVTSHSVVLSSLTPQMLYHFQIQGAGMVQPDMTFTTLMSSSTGTTTTTGSTTPTSGDIQNLITELQTLQSQINAINQQLQNALGILGGLGTIGGGTGTTTGNTGGAMVSASNATVSAGGAVDFGGRGFGHEETVSITRDGVVVGTAHADGGGNFSTGSMSVAGPTGAHTYLFVGQSSGFSANATVTVQ